MQPDNFGATQEADPNLYGDGNDEYQFKSEYEHGGGVMVDPPQDSASYQLHHQHHDHHLAAALQPHHVHHPPPHHYHPVVPAADVDPSADGGYYVPALHSTMGEDQQDAALFAGVEQQVNSHYGLEGASSSVDGNMGTNAAMDHSGHDDTISSAVGGHQEQQVEHLSSSRDRDKSSSSKKRRHSSSTRNDDEDRESRRERKRQKRERRKSKHKSKDGRRSKSSSKRRGDEADGGVPLGDPEMSEGDEGDTQQHGDDDGEHDGASGARDGRGGNAKGSSRRSGSRKDDRDGKRSSSKDGKNRKRRNRTNSDTGNARTGAGGKRSSSQADSSSGAPNLQALAAMTDIDMERADRAVASGRGNNKAKKRKKNAVVDENEASTSARTLLQSMAVAADADDVAFANKLPATAKLNLVESLNRIAAPKWSGWYLHEGVCMTFARWLAPLPNGDLPNLTIRCKVLDILKKLPLAADHLQGNALGRRLIHLYRSRNELEDNKTSIRTIVQQVMRPLLGLRWSYRGATRDHETFAEEGWDDDGTARTGAAGGGDNIMKPTFPTGELGATDNSMSLAQYDVGEDVRPSASSRARIPINTGYIFKILPRSTYDGRGVDNRSGGAGQSQLQKYVGRGRARTAAPTTQAYKVSISKSN